jgi:Fic/DOC family N-terminal
VFREKSCKLLEQANQALGRLDGLASILPDPSLFIYLYVRKEAVLSSQIEGTQLSKGRGSEKHPGEFRKSQNWIGCTGPVNAAFVPPPQCDGQASVLCPEKSHNAGFLQDCGHGKTHEHQRNQSSDHPFEREGMWQIIDHVFVER